MKTVLTFTEPFDSHAVFVSAALDLIGQPNDVLILDPILRDGGFSISLDGDEGVVSSRDQNIALSNADVGAFWNRRRLAYPYSPHNVLQADMPFLESSAFAFAKNVMLLSDGRFAVNSAAGLMRGGDKALQLRVAARNGLRVPHTLFSNNLDDIRAFLSRHGKIITKTYTNANWRTDDAFVSAFTAVITDIDSLPKESVELCPMIYQEFIEKEFELRVTVFGNYYCASRINSANSSEDGLDWRMGNAYLQDLRDTTIPDGLFAQLKRIMADLDIRFGSFDLAFSPQHGWVFFEVNEAGQFLWQEDYCATSSVLEPFARYLASGDDNFTFDPKTASSEITMGEIRKTYKTLRMHSRVHSQGLLPESASFVVDERTAEAVTA